MSAHKGDPTLPYPLLVFDHLLQAIKNWRLALEAFLCAYSMYEKLGGVLGTREFIAHSIEMFVILENVQPKSCDSHVIVSHQCHYVG